MLKSAFSAAFLGLLSLTIFITGCSDSDGYSTSKITDPSEFKPVGWFMRTHVRADVNLTHYYEHNTAGIFGALIDATDGKDSYDVLSYGPSLFQIVLRPFVPYGDLGRYFSTYHHFDVNNPTKKQVFLFQLTSGSSTVDLQDANLSIVIDGPYVVEQALVDGHEVYREVFNKEVDLNAVLSLVDLDLQKVYTYDELQNADLTMNSSATRSFAWVINGKVEESDLLYMLPDNHDYRLPPDSSTPDSFGVPPL